MALNRDAAAGPCLFRRAGMPRASAALAVGLSLILHGCVALVWSGGPSRLLPGAGPVTLLHLSLEPAPTPLSVQPPDAHPPPSAALVPSAEAPRPRSERLPPTRERRAHAIDSGLQRPPGATERAAADSFGVAAVDHYRKRSELDLPPRPLQTIEPGYPASAGLRGGVVRLRLLIDERGRVDEVLVLQASRPGIFDASVVEAFAGAAFSPGILAGRPVKSQMMIEVEFSPTDSSEGHADAQGG